MPAAKQRLRMLEAPLRARLADVALPLPGPADVVVRSRYSTFKHGTEMMAYLGRSPLANRAFDQQLRLFEPPQDDGQQFYPRPMGNMVVGTIETVGSNVRRLQPGQLVYAWAPIADVHVLAAAKLTPLGDLTPEQALCID